MRKRLNILVISLFLLATCPCLAQILRIHPLPTQPLLPVAQIHDIVQTPDGLMWYATSDGLCRDNGYQIDVFRPSKNDGGVMRNANIRNICVIKDGVAFATDEGLYKIDSHSLKISRTEIPARISRDISSIIRGHDGSIWISVDRKVSHLTAELQLIKTYATANNASALYEDDRHRIWALGNNALSVMAANGKRFEQKPWSGMPPIAMAAAGHNNYWVATYGEGIFLYNAITGKSVQQQASLDASDTRIISMKHDHNGLLWVSTMSGLDTYATDYNKLVMVKAIKGLPERKMIIDRLCEDRNGNIWVAGFSPTTFIVSPDLYPIKRIEVTKMVDATGFFLLADRMLADRDYYWIWQGRYGLGLYNGYDKLSFLWNVRPNGLSVVERDFIKNRNGSGIIAFGSNAVWRIWHDHMKIEAQKLAVVQGKVIAVREDAKGRLWIATAKRLYLYWQLSQLAKNVYNGDVRLLGPTIDGGNSCLIAKGKEVWKVSEDGTAAHIANIGQEITCITTAADGTPWASTREGNVYYCKNGKAIICKTPSDDNGNAIKQIVFDNAECLWTLTDQTVTQYNIQTKAYVSHFAADPDINVDYFYHLEPEQQGMAVSGAGAYCVLPTTDMGYKPGASIKPYITSVSTADTTILIGINAKKVDISSSATSVSICIASGEHLYAGKVSFAWREGRHGAWTTLDQGNNRAYIGTLSEGSHDIYVKATDRFGNWGDPVKCINLNRLPAWYETWWAMTLYVIAALAILAGLIWLANRIWYLKRLQRLRNELSLSHVNIEPEDISAKRYDSEFIKRMVHAIESHISDTGYNVLQLAEDMHTSRASLFRHCKSLTGKNPTSLIREIRLKAAANMLIDDHNVDIADIAEKTGFSSPSYFTKCFKEMFGILPNHYREKNRFQTDEAMKN